MAQNYFRRIKLVAPADVSFTEQYLGEDYYFDKDSNTVTRVSTGEVHKVRQWTDRAVLFDDFML